jgi:hypothetical protein
MPTISHPDAWLQQRNREVDLHDSNLASVEQADGAVVIRLAPAYVIASGDEPAKNGGTGWSLDVDIALHGASLKTSAPIAPGWIADGFVDLAGCARMYLLSLPSSLDGDLAVYLLTENSEELLVKAARMEVVQRGEPAFAETIDPEFWR